MINEDEMDRYCEENNYINPSDAPGGCDFGNRYSRESFEVIDWWAVIIFFAIIILLGGVGCLLLAVAPTCQ